MGWSSVMAHVADDDASDARVAIAAELAGLFERSRLIGVSACEIEVAPTDGYAFGAAVGEMLAIQREQAKARLNAAEIRFRALAETTGVDAEWRGAVASVRTHIARNARAADVIVIGRDAGSASEWGAVDAGDLLMSLGRPVLVTPPAPERTPAGAPVLVAWRDTRESQRALAAALPLMRRSGPATVVEICDPADVGAAQERVADVADWLRRHGVPAAAEVDVGDDRPVGERLIDMAGNLGVGLIVAGAYGHARLREWVFGGVSRSLLSSTPACLLTSH